MSQSLYKIESELAELLEVRQDLLSEIEMAPEGGYRDALRIALGVTEDRLAELFAGEVAKVDGIRAVWRHLEAVIDAAASEVKRQQERQRIARAHLDRLKTGVQAVMEMMPWREGKPRKIEGETGALYLKANGGKQAVEITDESLVPDEFKKVTVEMPWSTWRGLLKLAGVERVESGYASEKVTRCPSLSAIAAELERACERCKGKGEEADYVGLEMRCVGVPCSECGGSGKRGVPGARLAPRGQHVEVR